MYTYSKPYYAFLFLKVLFPSHRHNVHYVIKKSEYSGIIAYDLCSEWDTINNDLSCFLLFYLFYFIKLHLVWFARKRTTAELAPCR